MKWALLAVVILLPGCADKPPTRPAPVKGAPAGTSVSPPAPSASPLPSSPRPAVHARDGTRVRACRDGTCEVTVRSGTKIPLSRRFGMGPITVTIDDGDVGLRAHAPDTDMNDTVTAPGTVTLNDVTVDVVDAHDDVATLRISHR